VTELPMRSNDGLAPTIAGDVDLSLVGRALLRSWPILLLLGLLAGAATYFWSKSQPKIYRATTIILTANTQNSPGIINQTLVTAAPLPDGAAQEALRSSAVLSDIISGLKRQPDLTASERVQLTNTLSNELKQNQPKSLNIIPQIDPYGNGLYTLEAEAGTADGARILVDTSATSLIRWDANRALEGVQKSYETIKAQIADVDQQLREGAASGVERDTLLTTRSTLNKSLAQVSIMLKAASGTLTRVSPALRPFTPIAPRPFRNAVLAAVLSALLLGIVVTIRTLSDRTVKSEDDLLEFQSPTLATVPRLRRRDLLLHGIVHQAQAAGLYESVGFLRVNLLSMFPNKEHLRLTISSTRPGEGKSSVTASLADAFASSGKRVLVIDGDLRRGTQEQVWDKHNALHEWKQLRGIAGGRNLQQAIQDIENVQVLRVEPNVDLLPSGPGLHDSLQILTRADVESILNKLSGGYDVVLIDSPPLLAVADGLVLAKYTDGIVLVVEARTTTMQAVRVALRRADRSSLRLLGFVLNKADIRRDSAYNYTYDYKASSSSSS
jgi:capsular exopolysaccharide synthesis family protein